MKYLIKNIDNIKLKDLKHFYNNIYLYKRKKINNLKNDKNKILSIEGEMLLDKLLKKYYNLNYNDINFKVNKNGKPFINNKNIYFNISHSNEHVITCVSNKKIGVDIEKIRMVNLNIINQFATENEKEYILSTNKEIEKRLFTVYCLKEAYIKYKGLILNNIKDIEFIFNKNEILCSDNNVNIKIININNNIIAIIEEK